MFWQLHDYTIQTLKARLGAVEMRVPRQFAYKIGVLRGKPLVMTNVAFQTEHLRKVRLTYMDAGNAAQILTTMAFPRFHTDAPIFGADMLAFRGKPHLIVIDHQPLYKSDAEYVARYVQPLADVYGRFAHLPAKDKTLPPWTEAFFSMYTHYSRPPLAYLPEVLAAYRAYWDAYLDQIAQVKPLPHGQRQDVQLRQSAYCRDHIENEQAESMLRNMFGNEWCESFINQFLFDVHYDDNIADLEQAV